MDAGLPVAPHPAVAAERAGAPCPIRAAAARVIQRTRLAWAAAPAVSAADPERPRPELRAAAKFG